MVPDRSDPSVSGRGCGRALLPARIQASQGPTPAALTRTRTSPPPGDGTSICSSVMTSDGPKRLTREAVMIEGSVVIVVFLSPDGIYLAGLVRIAPSGATKTASRLAGSELLAFSLTRCMLPGGSKK